MTTMNHLGRIALILVLALTLSGCLLHAPGLDPVRRDLEAEFPSLELEPAAEIRLGRLSMALARSIARMAAEDEDEEMAFDLLHHIKGVEVAVYETYGLSDEESQRLSRRLTTIGSRNGWVPFARMSEDDSSTAIYFQQKGDRIKSVHLFAVDDEGVVLARFKGNMDRVIADAIAMNSEEITELVADQAD